MRNYPDLTSNEWDGLTKRLSLYAHTKLIRLAWRGARPDPPDIAAEAICKVIAGKRSWNAACQPDFEAFLRTVVDSEVNHLVESKEHRVRSSQELPKEPAELLGRSKPGAPERLSINAEESLERDRLRGLIIRAIQGDEIIEQLFDCLSAGFTAPSEIADLLGIDVKEINNAKKRLKRKVEEALAKQRVRAYGQTRKSR